MMADPEITSVSGSETADPNMEDPIMEVTSASESEPPKQAPKCRGRSSGQGRGRGAGRQKGVGSSHASAKAPKSHGRGRARGRRGTTWLHHPRAERDPNVEETSASEETARIQAAAKR